MQFESSHWLPSWVMSHYTMLYKYGKGMCEYWGVLFLFWQSSFLYFGGVLNKKIILLALVGYEMII